MIEVSSHAKLTGKELKWLQDPASFRNIETSGSPNVADPAKLYLLLNARGGRMNPAIEHTRELTTEEETLCLGSGR